MFIKYLIISSNLAFIFFNLNIFYNIIMHINIYKDNVNHKRTKNFKLTANFFMMYQKKTSSNFP